MVQDSVIVAADNIVIKRVVLVISMVIVLSQHVSFRAEKFLAGGFTWWGASLLGLQGVWKQSVWTFRESIFASCTLAQTSVATYVYDLR